MSNVGVAKYWVPACVKAHCREARGWVPKGYYFGLVRREFPSCRVFWRVRINAEGKIWREEASSPPRREFDEFRPWSGLKMVVSVRQAVWTPSVLGPITNYRKYTCTYDSW